VLALVAVVLALMPAGMAQSTFGSIVGTVKDPTGLVLADCVVTVMNQGTSAQRATVSDASGNFTLLNLDPGTYQLTLQAPGFQISTFKNIQLLARDTVRIDGNLSLATQVESVNVTAEVGVITTETSSIAETKTGRELMDLPVALASRAAGSTSPISTLSTQAGVQVDNAGALSIAGSKPSMLSVTIDGISTVNVRSNAAAAELFPSFGAIAEIHVSEINNAAEFGGVSDITTVSKGGTNSFHGGVFENHQNTAMTARNTFSTTKPKIIMNNYGAFVGGPLIRDKTFYFGSFEGLRLPRETFINQSVPSLAMRAGDLSALPGTIKDPATGQAFANKQIPLSKISPVSLAALQYLWPLPNTGAPSAISNNYQTNFATPITSDQGDFRIDQNLGSRQNFFVRATYKKRVVDDAPSSSQSVVGGPNHQPERNYSITVAHNFVMTPTVVNELRLGLSDIYSQSASGINATEIIPKIGIQVPDPPPGTGTPGFTINGFQPTSTQTNSVSRSKTLQILDNVSWTRNSHTFKFGGDIRILSAYFSNVFAGDRLGRYTFNGSVTNSIVGHPYAAFLLGIPDTVGIGVVNGPDSNGASTHWAFYAQDDWKITPRFTLNYGMRWEYHPPFLDRLNNIAVFMPNIYSVINGVSVRGALVVPDAGFHLNNPVMAASIAPTPIFRASEAGIPQQLHTSQRTSFGPRVGFAWRPTSDGKTVIRGGYGKFIETLLGNLTGAGWGVGQGYTGTYTNSISNGQPALSFPNPVPANLAQPGTLNLRLSADVNYRDPYVQQWSFTIERDLGFSTGVRVSYDGNKGSNLGYTINLAQIPANTIGFAAAKSASPFPLFSRISHATTGARSNYHALTIEANKRFAKGLQFSVNYAFAKNLSNGQGGAPTSFTNQRGGTATDPYNLDLDYGPVAFTRRHRFQTTFLYELPFGERGTLFRTSNPIVDRVIGGWQISGVLLAQTGPYLTVLAPGADPAGNNFPNLESAGRADSVAGQSVIPEDQNIRNWINKAAFAIPRNNIGRPGNSPLGSVVGPGTQVLSLSLFKTVKITERINVQVGAAASNLLNHPNYSVPNLNYGTNPFGTITNLQSQENAGPRALQVTGRLSF
jgi:hypothetical protein